MSPVPPPVSPRVLDYGDWSADDTIAAIRNKSVTAREYISDVLDRARQGKPLNAFIRLLPDQALSAADEIDRAVARGRQLPPLAGLAIVAKDNINQAGIPTTAGTAALLGNRPPATAPSLRKLIAAGAIVVGRANMHELALGFTSTNLQPFAGPVHNPYAEGMIPGGSSGGTAAAIASRVVTCGLGTDTGGSSRVPAALTGIAGFRPSVGEGGAQRRYHDDGAVVPISHTRDTVGPMGRTVADIALLDSVISGRPRARPAELRGLRLGVPPVLWSGLDRELESIALRAGRRLQAAGVVLVRDDMPDLLRLDATIGSPIALHEPLADMPAYLRASGARVRGVDIGTIAHGIASPDVRAIWATVLKDAFGPQYEQVMTVRRPALQRLYADYFSRKRVDAILFPTTILPATPIDYVNGSGNVSVNGGPPVAAFGAYTRNAGPGSDAGIPGLSIPAGLTAGGLPIGIEIDGPRGSDERLLALGLAIEAVLGRLPPPPRPRKASAAGVADEHKSIHHL
ncbi:hypothetical protein C2857_000218 [Epichloe festucae Fl1]|uniref:Amidase domain-containing protein n=1 Tax=Epichloe festucae (strain Fl1) TaxID=877507 RepID=A0A7S9KJP5_EPIFF|nr:hypothetical protein C2857_000218 [Epichloe festucae Fl1]